MWCSPIFPNADHRIKTSGAHTCAVLFTKHDTSHRYFNVEGHLPMGPISGRKRYQQTMIPVAEALILRPGCYQEYKRRHDELWPELAEVMRENGISMVIHRFEDTLFIYGTAPSQEAWARVEEHAVTPRWNQYMAEVLETDEHGHIIVHHLDRAFDFGDLP